MKIECTGRLTEKGNILVNPSVFKNIKIGSKMKIIISVTEEHIEGNDRKELSPAANRLLERMRTAKKLGSPIDPEELSHSKLAEERMEEKFPWSD